MRNSPDIAYILGYLAMPVAIIVVIIITAVVGKIKRNKKTEHPRAKKTIQKELKELLNSEDRKVKGTLLAWCIVTGIMISQGIIFGGNEFANWIHAGFLLTLLILAIKGRGSRVLISIAAGLIAIGSFFSAINTAGTSLKMSYCFSDWSKCMTYSSIPDDIWEKEAEKTRIGGAIIVAYYGITAFCLGFSKKAKKHFAWGQRKAELWLELEKRDNLDNTETQAIDESESKPENVAEDEQEGNEDDIREQLKELKKQNKKLADTLDRIEKSNTMKGKKK